MSSFSNDQEYHLDQTPPALPGPAPGHSDEPERYNYSPEVKITSQIEESDMNKPGPFNAPYDAQQVPTKSRDLPQIETATEEDSLKYSVEEMNKTDNSSMLHVTIAKSPLVKHHMVTDSPEPNGADPLAILTKMGKIIEDYHREQVKLQNCLKESDEDNQRKLKSNEKELESTKEDLKVCQQEKEELEQKYEKVVETEAETRRYYEERHGHLENQLKELQGEKEEADKQHKENKALLTQTLEIQSKYCTELEQKLKRQAKELTEFESRYKAKQADVERLRESLQQQEKELQEMEKECTTKTAQFRELERQTKVMTISQEKKTTQEQLQRCQQIRELVERLPQVTTQEGEAITKQISEDITRMKAATTRKKAISWR